MFINILALVMFFSFSANAGECLETKAAFDIGSGTTKLKVARVDICQQKIVKMLYESSRPVGYKQAIKESKDNKLSKSIIEFGSKKILELMQEAKRYKPKMYIAAATSAFRTASNGNEAVMKLSQNTGVSIHIITQEKEAKIGFVGASVITDTDLKNIVVWDIGGGSMQMISYNGNENFDIFLGKLASVSFKNYIIERIQGEDATKVKSPNPISEIDKNKLITYLNSYAEVNVPKSIRDKLKKKSTKVVGIGGVHYYSVGKVVSNTSSYNINKVQNMINKYIDKSDEQLGGGEYVHTNVSNLILVNGIMKALEINEVNFIKVNLANGILIKPELLK